MIEARADAKYGFRNSRHKFIEEGVILLKLRKVSYQRFYIERAKEYQDIVIVNIDGPQFAAYGFIHDRPLEFYIILFQNFVDALLLNICRWNKKFFSVMPVHYFNKVFNGLPAEENFPLAKHHIFLKVVCDGV